MDRERPQHAVIEESPFVPHVTERPSEYRMCQPEIVRILILKRHQRDDALGYRVNIDGIVLIVKVFRGAVIPEKMTAVKLKSAFDVCVELVCRETCGN